MPTTPGTPRETACPTCGKAVQWNADAPDRPFCSERCRLIDLGEWASEGFRIPAQESPTGIDIDPRPDSGNHSPNH